MPILLSRTLWLVAALSIREARGEDSIQFDNADFRGSNSAGAAVYIAPTILQPRTFRWHSNQRVAVSIKEVNLRVDNGTLVGQFSANVTSTVSSGTAPSTPATPPISDGVIPAGTSPIPAFAHTKTHGIFLPVISTKRSGWLSEVAMRDVESIAVGTSPTLPGLLSLIQAADQMSGNVSINDPARLDDNMYASKKMWLELLWDAPDGQHTVFSRAFTFTPASSDDEETSLSKDPTYQDPNPVHPEQVGPDSGVQPSIGAPSPSSTPAPSLFPSTAATTLPAGSATAVQPVGASATSSPRPAGHPSSGLSTGAIAGIAVAAALVGLGLLATLVFCLLRHRRRRRPRDRLADSAGPPGGYRSRVTPELIAQKESNAAGVGGVVEVAPHSPYSDDGAAVPAHAGGLRYSTVRQEEVLLAGYADPDLSRRSVAEDGGSLRGSQTGRNTPGRATPTAVRHLVEEGMTDDEIRRLEEEERELDQAIEQAGGGGRR